MNHDEENLSREMTPEEVTLQEIVQEDLAYPKMVLKGHGQGTVTYGPGTLEIRVILPPEMAPQRQNQVRDSLRAFIDTAFFEDIVLVEEMRH